MHITSRKLQMDSIRKAVPSIPPEYQFDKTLDATIMQQIEALMNKKDWTIQSIEFVNNHALYQNYEKTRSSDKGSGKENEQLLWHGTKHRYVNSIKTHGFKAEETRNAAFGPGTYFAEDVEAAAMYVDDGHLKDKYIFLCNVQEGNVQTGDKYEKTMDSMKVDDDKALDKGYVVVGDNSRIYPTFILHFQTNTDSLTGEGFGTAADPYGDGGGNGDVSAFGMF